MRRPRENRNCPYCLSPIEENEERIRCPKCGVTHHAECWRANGKCSVYGCDGWALWSSEIAERITPAADAEIDVTEQRGRAKQKNETTRCMECGGPVRPDQLVCWNCRRRHNEGRWENCLGPSMVMVGGVIWGLVEVIRALT